MHLMELIREELTSLVEDGEIDPSAVVKAARNKNSAMHDQFTWDNSEAAAEYRLQQARALIKRVQINVIRSDNTVVRVPVFVRSPMGAGYREAQEVMASKPDRVAIMQITLLQCRTMLFNLAAPELDEIIEAIELTRASFEKQRAFIKSG